MSENLSYAEVKQYLENDPAILKLALAIMGMLPPDKRPVDSEQIVNEEK
jgi:hypothetical protein